MPQKGEKEINLDNNNQITEQKSSPNPPLKDPLLSFRSPMLERLKIIFRSAQEDIVGKNVALMYEFFSKNSHLLGMFPLAKTLHSLLPKLLPPPHLLIENKDQLIHLEDLNLTSPELKPLEEFISNLNLLLIEVDKQEELSALKKPLRTILSTYSNYRDALIKTPLELREKFLEAKAQLIHAELGHLLIEQTLARKLICRDEYNTTLKSIDHGIHLVVRLEEKGESIFFKPNPEGKDFVAPGMEYAMVGFHHTISGDISLAAPTDFVKVRLVMMESILSPFECPNDQAHQIALQIYNDEFVKGGKSTKEILRANPQLKDLRKKKFYCERVIQAGYGLDGDSWLLQDMLGLLQAIEELEQVFGGEKELIESLPQLLDNSMIPTLGSKFETDNNNKLEKKDNFISLFDQYFEYSQTQKKEDRFINFQNCEDNNKRNFQELVVDVFRKFGEETSLWLLALIRRYPQLMKNNSLEELLRWRKYLKSMGDLLPSQSLPERIRTLKNWMEYLDATNVSQIFFLSLMLNFADAKADNYMAMFTRDHLSGNVISWRIAGFDNDKALSQSIVYAPKEDGHFSGVKCIFYLITKILKKNVSPSFAKFLLERPEAVLLFVWLKGLYAEAQRHQRLIQAHILTENDLVEEVITEDSTLKKVSKLNIPFHLPQGCIKEMFKKFKSITAILKETKRQVRLGDLLNTIQPILSLYYEKIKNLRASPKEALLCITRETKREFSIETLLEGDVDLAFLQEIKITEDDCEKREQTITDAIKELWEEIDFLFIKSSDDQLCLLESINGIDHLLEIRWDISTLNNLLHAAVRKPSPDAVEVLLRLGADVNCVDDAGRTPLHILTEKMGFPEYSDSAAQQILTTLLSVSNIKLNLRDKIFYSPLFYWVDSTRKQPKRAKFWLDACVAKGLDLEIKDEGNRTALDKTIQRNQPSTFVLLIGKNAGVNVNAKAAIEFVGKNSAHEGMSAAFEKLKLINHRVTWQLTLKTISSKTSPMKLTLTGTESGDLYLDNKLIDQLIRGIEGKKSQESRGTHIVIPLTFKAENIHTKLYPTFPLVEKAIEMLAHQLFGRGTPTVELFKIRYKNKALPILFSQTIQGKNLEDVLKKNQIDVLNQIDPESFAEAFLLSLIINPGDNHPGNFIVLPIPNSEGKISYYLICVDNDLAFVAPFIIEIDSLGNAQLKLNIKNIGFLLDNMLRPLIARTVQSFLTTDAYAILKNWLSSLKPEQIKMLGLFIPKEWEEFKKHGVLPDLRLGNGAIAKIFEKIKRIQKLLRENPQITPLELLKEVMPGLGVFYAKAFATCKDPKSRYEFLEGNYYSKDLKNMAKEKNFQSSKTHYDQSLGNLTIDEALAELEEAQEEEEKVEKLLENLPVKNVKKLLLNSSREKVFRKIDFGEYPKKEQEEILKGFGEVVFEDIVLENIDALTDSIFADLLRASYNLKSLTIVNCSNLTKKSLVFSAKNFPALEILHLKGLKISNICQSKIGKNLSLKFASLRRLEIIDCPRLSSVQVDMPEIKILTVRNCPTLKNFPLNNTKLTHLEFSNCPKLPEVQIIQVLEQQSKFVAVKIAECNIDPKTFLIYIAKHDLWDANSIAYLQQVGRFHNNNLEEDYSGDHFDLKQVDGAQNNYLDLGGLIIDSISFGKFAASAPEIKSLIKLNLGGNVVSIAALTEILSTCRDLRVITLANEEFSLDFRRKLKNKFMVIRSTNSVLLQLTSMSATETSELLGSCQQLVEVYRKKLKVAPGLAVHVLEDIGQLVISINPTASERSVRHEATNLETSSLIRAFEELLTAIAIPGINIPIKHLRLCYRGIGTNDILNLANKCQPEIITLEASQPLDPVKLVNLLERNPKLEHILLNNQFSKLSFQAIKYLPATKNKKYVLQLPEGSRWVDSTTPFWDNTNQDFDLPLVSLSNGVLVVVDDLQKISLWNLHSKTQLKTFQIESTSRNLGYEKLPTYKGNITIPSNRGIDYGEMPTSKRSLQVTALAALTGNKFVCGLSNGCIRLYDTSSENYEEWRVHSGSVSMLTISKNQLVITGDENGKIKIWSMQGKKLVNLTTIEAHKKSIKSCATFVKHNLLVSSADDGVIKFWDINTGRYNNSLAQRFFQASVNDCKVTAIAFFDDDSLVIGDSKGSIKIWNIISGKYIVTLNGNSSISSLVVISKSLIAASSHNDVRLWDIDNNECVNFFETKYRCNLVLTADGILVARDFLGVGELWDFQKQYIQLSSLANFKDKFSLVNTLWVMILQLHTENINTENGNFILSQTRDFILNIYQQEINLEVKKELGQLIIIIKRESEEIRTSLMNFLPSFLCDSERFSAPEHLWLVNNYISGINIVILASLCPHLQTITVSKLPEQSIIDVLLRNNKELQMINIIRERSGEGRVPKEKQLFQKLKLLIVENVLRLTDFVVVKASDKISLTLADDEKIKSVYISLFTSLIQLFEVFLHRYSFKLCLNVDSPALIIESQDKQFLENLSMAFSRNTVAELSSNVTDSFVGSSRSPFFNRPRTTSSVDNTVNEEKATELIKQITLEELIKQQITQHYYHNKKVKTPLSSIPKNKFASHLGPIPVSIYSEDELNRKSELSELGIFSTPKTGCHYYEEFSDDICFYQKSQTSEEAKKILEKEATGTFLFRESKSSQGCMVISYLDDERKVQHLLLIPQENNLFIISNYDSSKKFTLIEIFNEFKENLKFPAGTKMQVSTESELEIEIQSDYGGLPPSGKFK